MGLLLERRRVLLDDARHRRNFIREDARSSCPSCVMAGIASYSHQFVFEVHLCWASPE